MASPVVNVLVVESDSDRKAFPSIAGVQFRRCAIDELADTVSWAEVLLFRTFEAADLQAVWPNAANLQWIHASSAGVDRLLDPGLREGPWLLTNSGGILDHAIAEYVAAGILASVKKLPQALRRQRERVWEHRVSSGVRGKRALVVGPGSIGREIGRALGALGMRVDASGTSERPGDAEFARIRDVEELRSYAGEYAVIVLATPLTERTRGLVGTEVLAAMSPDAGLVNISRGPVVDEQALCAALASGTIGWAVLDVFEVEPLPASSPLWNMDNVILTAHLAGDADDFAERLWQLFEENLERYLHASPLVNVVDKQTGYVQR
ncbi:D-2-hydroxyacid dehydrogenase [Rhodococcoides fascians A21d2]|uniref:D-2-hydroxyacid dehydrogenase n=1 Tax=Rhodococcoides fascians TaxID=1828 RepID=UPI0009B83074|nr:D-2-hydroxyacid dehydrogenase [Rhodococcus fascians]QIH99066.1 D-2-hydroxyacid dehydrogenase [Rhodococcus fascians A21d2]